MAEAIKSYLLVIKIIIIIIIDIFFKIQINFRLQLRQYWDVKFEIESIKM